MKMVASIAMIAVAIVLHVTGPTELDWLPDGFEKPVLALELVNTPREFHDITRQTTLQPRQQLAGDLYRRNTKMDFLFIAAYACLWIAILWQLPGAARVAAVAVVVIAASADVVENVGILHALQVDVPTMLNVRVIRTAAMVKWGLLGTAFVLLAHRFWPDKEVRDGWQLWQAAIALAYGYAGVLCLVGLLHNPVIERTALPLATAVLMQMPLFWHERRTIA